MGDIKYWDTSYGKALDEWEDAIAAGEKLSGEERQRKLGEAKAMKSRLDGMKRSYNLEIKLMRDAAQKATYNAEKASKDLRLEELSVRLTTAQASTGQKQELFGKKRAAQGKGGGAEPLRQPTADEKLDEATRVQDATESAYGRIISVLVETEDVAGNTAQELRNQRDQINDITETVMEVESSLKRADRLVKVFSKRMMTDKFIQLFGCLNVCLLVGIIVYVVIKQVGLPGSSTSTPPNPASTVASSGA
ncbi:unnamed protein product [Phaeothamnion confervicola]